MIAAGLGLYIRGELIDAFSPTPYNDCDEFERCKEAAQDTYSWTNYCPTIYWKRLFPSESAPLRQCYNHYTPAGREAFCGKFWNKGGLC